MKFVISTQELNYLINKCQNIISPRPTIPLLSNFLIEATGNELVITATDLTVGIRCSTETKILEEGATTLPAKKFSSLIRELTAVNLEISTDANEITTIIADSSRFKLNGMSRDEFPSLPDLTEAIAVPFLQNQLKEMFFRTAFAVSREDNRYALTGVFLQIENGAANFIGTDGKRLAKAHMPVKLDPDFTGNYIIPLKAVEEIQKNLGESGEATLHLMSDKIAIETENALLVTKLLIGDYPDVNRVIPENIDVAFSLHKGELMTILRQISLFAVEENHSVRFSFTEGELKLTANTMEVGEGKVSMPVNYRGSPLDIAFNPGYFLDILKHSNGETVTMGLTDAFNPGMITDKEQKPSKSTSPLFILMPMRLSDDENQK